VDKTDEFTGIISNQSAYRGQVSLIFFRDLSFFINKLIYGW